MRDPTRRRHGRPACAAESHGGSGSRGWRPRRREQASGRCAAARATFGTRWHCGGTASTGRCARAPRDAARPMRPRQSPGSDPAAPRTRHRWSTHELGARAAHDTHGANIGRATPREPRSRAASRSTHRTVRRAAARMRPTTAVTRRASLAQRREREAARARTRAARRQTSRSRAHRQLVGGHCRRQRTKHACT